MKILKLLVFGLILNSIFFLVGSAQTNRFKDFKDFKELPVLTAQKTSKVLKILGRETDFLVLGENGKCTVFRVISHYIYYTKFNKAVVVAKTYEMYSLDINQRRHYHIHNKPVMRFFFNPEKVYINTVDGYAVNFSVKFGLDTEDYLKIKSNIIFPVLTSKN